MDHNSKNHDNNRRDRVHRSLSLRERLKVLYTSLAPPGSRGYKFTRTFLLRLLNKRYRYWIKHYDSYSEKDLHKFLKKSANLPIKPRISVILPVYNPKLSFLNQAIKSIHQQAYPYWELCIADDASTNPGVRKKIEAHHKMDSRIKVVYREQNGHISAASNSALALATGDYIALLDHDDVLHPLALYYVAVEINTFQDTEVIYSDEDKITRDGTRISPYFKSEFDYQLQLCQNMVSHLGVYKTETVRQLGGFRVGFEGSQDYDLLLRMVEVIKTHQIRHIPRILYHWRISNQSAASSTDAKPYAIQSATRAISEHLERVNIKAQVKPRKEFGYKIDYIIKHPNPFIDLFIIANKSTKSLLEGVRSLIINTGYDLFKLHICIRDETCLEQKDANLKEYEKKQNIIIHHSATANFNEMIRLSSVEYVGIIDEDTIKFSPYWLKEMLSLAMQVGIGAVSPKLIYPNNTIYSCGVILGVNGIANSLFNNLHNDSNSIYYYGWNSLNKGFSAFSPKCLIFNHKHFQRLGGINNNLTTITAKFIDFCLKLREDGLRNVLAPDVNVTINNPTVDKHNQPSDELIPCDPDQDYFMGRWAEWIKNDPSFNPNLTIIRGKPVVAKEPRLSPISKILH